MLDHTADVGFEVVEAPTLEDLFDETRQALLMTVFEESPERGEDEDSVWLSAPDLETLLVRWINELVFFIQGDGFVPVSARLQDGRTIPLPELEALLAAIAAGDVPLLSVRVQ